MAELIIEQRCRNPGGSKHVGRVLPFAKRRMPGLDIFSRGVAFATFVALRVLAGKNATVVSALSGEAW